MASADWDLSAYFSGLGAGDYVAFRDQLAADLRALQRPGVARPLDAGRLVAIEDADARLGHLSSYLSCSGAADARDEQVQRETAALAELEAALAKVMVGVRAALRALPDAAFDALLADAQLAGAEHFLRRERRRAAQAMEPELEELTADLGVTGLSAWGRLYDQVSGTLRFSLDGRALPVAMARSYLEDPDPDVRRAALVGANAAWESVGAVVAACLNAISGTRLTLYERRGVDHFLQPALIDAGIERATLDAMMDAVRGRQDVARRYLRRKAERLGLPVLGFQDTMAPLPGSHAARIPWPAAVARVRDAFGAYPALRAFAERAFDRRWIDHSPRDGKRPGGFCSSSHVIGESRIFMTYNGSMGEVQTLAHELGHAYHNWVMRDLRPWARDYPMTLAETASTFAEQLVTDAALASPELDDAAKLAILDHRLMEGAIFTLNIPMRFDFEHSVYERRAAGELSVTELVDLMLAAQRRNYGDSLAADQLDPWYWASKLHFYITEISFYNFPYTFGYLFSLGIFARAKAEGPAFYATYERLLRHTGSAPAEQVARDALGVDLQQPEFWNASIDLIEADLERY